MRTRVKICGMTRPEDALAAARLGADAIGLVFYPSSPRAVSIVQAQAIRRILPPFVTVVGLFVNAGVDEIRRVMEAVPLDVVQFHGDESSEQCRAAGRPYIKALRMREGLDVRVEAARYGDAGGILLDTYQEGVPGGTGQRFDWSRIPAELNIPLILAGGLMPENVAEAIGQVHPYAVDVSGGVESTKGVKDINKMRAFIEGVNSVKTA